MSPKDQPTGRRRPWLKKRILIPVVVSLATGAVIAIAPGAEAAVPFPVASLDGSGNNVANPTWGQAGRAYARVGTTHYADGIGSQQTGPNARSISNRLYNDANQNVFSERRVTQWGFVWGQFLDHTFGLRESTGATATQANIPFNASDPMETFTNNLGVVPFTRSAATPGTGTSTANPRQQTNTENSYIDAEVVYGASNTRLDWLRAGPLDGNPTNNQANLLMSANNYLPRATARGNASNAPAMDHDGRLAANPGQAMVAGDPRANENIALTALQTLFVREHNRIVAALPNVLSSSLKFEIARRVVGAEVQRITYEEFLPSVGVRLPRYRGYDRRADATLSNEFATTAFRAHSMVHGEFEIDYEPGAYTPEQLALFKGWGIQLIDEPDEQALVIPLSVAFGNPDLLEAVGEGPVLESLGGERQYRNDEQIDNTRRSVLFQVPKPGMADPSACQTPVIDPECFNGVVDLGALDVMRGRDHGIPNYNELRRAYGLAPRTDFASITGEASEAFPNDPLIDPADPIDDPDTMDFVEVRDADGVLLDLDDPDSVENAVTGVRRSPLAARLKALYGTPDAVDAFTGMVAEPHAPGAELGELQQAIWTEQFRALRDGDRFFYARDDALRTIRERFGVSVLSLAEVVAANTEVTIGDAPFFVAPE